MQHTLPAARHANLHFVTSQLAIGGDVDPRRADLQLAEIRDMGITHVIDCRLEWNDEDLFARRLPLVAYLHHGMDDAGQRVPPAWFDTAIAFHDAAGPEARLLAHCHMGINRGPSLGFAVLLHQGWDAIEAITAVRRARPIAHAWYADDALRWYHGRAGTDPDADLRRMRQWRETNPLDVVRIIRGQREQGL